MGQVQSLASIYMFGTASYEYWHWFKDEGFLAFGQRVLGRTFTFFIGVFVIEGSHWEGL